MNAAAWFYSQSFHSGVPVARRVPMNYMERSEALRLACRMVRVAGEETRLVHERSEERDVKLDRVYGYLCRWQDELV